MSYQTRVMTHVPPYLAEFAHRLFVHEARGGQRTQDLVDAMERACQALHTRLAPLVSVAGSNALLERAVQLAAREFPFLADIGGTTAPNGSLGGLPDAVEGRQPAEVADALVAILANFIWLLVIFIGENLGLRKVHEVWPDVPLPAPDSSPGKAPQ
jgi:hypothetical protein